MSAAVDTALFVNLVPLNSLNARNQSNLARQCRLESAAAGSCLFKLGDVADAALFVLEGTVQLENAAAETLDVVRGGEPGSCQSLAHESPRRFTARCIGPVRYLSVDAGLLDVMLSAESQGDYEVAELSAGIDAACGDWMTRLLRMRVFQQVPPANLQAMFMRMSEIRMEPGQRVIRQGDIGDYFYVLVEGSCLVTRESPGNTPVQLAELAVGACFGEEALIADERRNATITMLASGRLMRLSRHDFRALLDEPLSRRLGYAEAAQRVAQGTARWLDVRMQSEFQGDHLPGSVNLPLYLLRRKLIQLDPSFSWIVVCDNGRRSTVASFILGQKGYDAWLLDGGLPRQQ